MEDGDNYVSLVELVRLTRWDEAKELVEADPSSVYRRSRQTGQFPIHMLCTMVESFESMEEEECSDAEMGHHAAAGFERNRDIYALAKQMVLASHCDIGEVQVEQDRLDSDGEVATSFVRCRSILQVRNHLGHTPLHEVCMHQADTTMMQIFFDCCGESEIDGCTLIAELIMARDHQGSTPLHYIFESREAPLSALKLMLEKASSSVVGFLAYMVRDVDGELPIHWAMNVGVSPRRLELILQHNRECLLEEDNLGHLPLSQYHDSFLKQSDEDLQTRMNCLLAVLRVVCGVHPDGDWEPLHQISSIPYIVPPSIFSLLLDYSGQDAYRYDKSGRTPLHSLLSVRPQSGACDNHARVLKLFLEDPRVRHDLTDSQARLPLHIASFSGQRLWVMEALHHLMPQSLTTVDPVTKLPPFALAAAGTNQSLSVVYFLLRSDPSVIQHLMGASL